MTSTSIVSVVFLLCTRLVFSQGQAIGTCSTENTRRNRVANEVAALDCESLDCGKCNASYNTYQTYNTLATTALYKTMLNVTASNPAASCAEIFLSLGAPSGYYWLQSTNGSAVHVFCDMTLTCKGVGGGWMQVAKLNMTNSSHQCPPGTRLRTDLPKRLCGINSDHPGCTSAIFNVHAIQYSQVCGKIIAYQDAATDSFRSTHNSLSVDDNYVDGISLTFGRNPRKHIWTFASALDEVGSIPQSNCRCTNTNQATSASRPPNFVGNDYFCDTASVNHWEFIFYPDDPLWDGAGCGPANTCCSLNNPPWFLKQLPSNTTDDIEMRMCRDHPFINGRVDEDTPIEVLELYIR